MRIPSTSLKEIPSPDNNYCVCLFGLPTPKGEPQRLTFTLYKNQNGAKQAIFDLPEDLYCCDGVDCIYWDDGSTAITYTVNQYKSIFIYDFIFQIKKEKPVPDNLVKCYWDKNIGNWILKSRSRIEEFRIYYSHNDIRDFFFFNWGNTQIELIKTPFKEHKDHPLFKVFFMNTDHDFRYAETTDSLFVYNPTLITINENEQARIPVCDAYLTEYSCLICELSQFGQGDNFIVKKEDSSDSPISLSIKDLPSDQSPFYSVRQDCKGLGESGLTQYLDLEFIDKQTGKVHYSYPRRKDSKGEWNNDRTKFFFDGSEEMLDEDDVYYTHKRDYDVFVVLDVKNKTCIKEYRGSALHPRWNEEGSDVIFDNQLKPLEVAKAREAEKARLRMEEAERARAMREEERLRKEQETPQSEVISQGPPFYILPSPDGIHCVYLKLRQQKGRCQRCLYDVSIIDKSSNAIIVTGFKNAVEGPEPIRQLTNGKVTFYTEDFSIISFNLKDLFNNKVLNVSIRPVPAKPQYVWNEKEGIWDAILDGKPFAPRPFYYDHLHYEDFFKLPILYFRHFRGPLLGDSNYDTSDRYEIQQKSKGFDRLGMPAREKLAFIDKKDGQTHLEIAFDMDQRFKENDPVEHPVWQGWNRRGTKFFFSGYAQPRYEFRDSKIVDNHHGRLVVVVDVKDKDIIGIYKFKPTCLPYWDSFGKIQFTEPAEEQQECLKEALNLLHNPQATQATPPDTHLAVCTTEDPVHPNCYQVCIIDADKKRIFAKIDPYRLTFKYAVRQSGNIVCFYGTIPDSSDSYIVRFDMSEIYTEKELVLSVWNLHKPVVNYVWNSEKAFWFPVIDGKEIHPSPFYYDDQYMESVPITFG